MTVVLMRTKWGWLGGKEAAVSGLECVGDRCAAMAARFVTKATRIFV